MPVSARSNIAPLLPDPMDSFDQTMIGVDVAIFAVIYYLHYLSL